MAAPRESLNKATHSVGFHAKFVTVTAITADSLWAITTDRQFIETRVPLLVQRSKGPLPEVGDTWLIDQAMGSWTFAAFVGKSTADFAGKTVAMDVADLIYVQSSPPSSPQLGDMWMNSARGNELSQWQGSGWVALQFGTAAIANKSITAAKLADKTVTAQQISDTAGITSSQVAFTIHDLGGMRVFSGTSQPTGMQPGDLWVNPVQGNALATWDGALWHSLQFGALAIAPSSITAAQISGSAGISAGMVNFTASEIGGITTSIAAAQPANPKIGDLWYDATNGYVLDQWNGTAWVPFQYGTNAIQAGSITAALIAANTITAAQIAAGTITAAQIAAGTITASLFAATGTNDYNAYFAGGDATGWRGFGDGGTFQVVSPAGAPYTYVGQIAADGVTGGPKIAPANPGPAEIPCQPGNVFLVSALVWTTLSSVTIGATWNDSGYHFLSNSTQVVSVTPSTWTYVYNIVTAPANAAFMQRFAGLTGTPALGTIFQATAISALSSFDGGVITAGTITAAQIAAGTITADNIQAGTITAGLLDANAIDGMTINGGVINGGTVNAADVLVQSTAGGIFVYGTSTYPTVEVWSGNNQTVNWTAPPGITSVLVELWGSGGGGAYDNSANGGGGGAGGAYAASTITVVPGNVYTFHIGTKGAAGTSGSPNGGTGGDTTWQTSVVVAKGGGGGTPTAAGTHQTGSVGTTVFQGGNGALGVSQPPSFLAVGGGGGGSAGSTLAGKNAAANGPNGAAAVSDGGPGGHGAGGSNGWSAVSPTTGPGGGGGGGCSVAPAGAAGFQGQVRLTYQNVTTALSGAIAGSSGTDPIAGISYNEGANFDHITDNQTGNQIRAAETDTTTVTFTSASDIAITTLWNIPANDVGGETVYDLYAWGHGTWGATAQNMQVDGWLNGTAFTGAPVLDATTFNVNELFNFEIHLKIMFTLNGASGTFKWVLKVVASSNAHGTQNGYTMIRRGTGVSCNTTVLNQLQLAAAWGATTGSPTATCEGSIFQRLGN